MKSKLPIFVTALIVSSSSFAIDQKRVESFSTRLQEACNASDVAKLKKLYFLEGVPEPLVDQEVYRWERWLIDFVPNEGWTFEGVEFLTIEKLLDEPGMNKKEIAHLIEPKVMNGNTYGHSLEVAGFARVGFKLPHGGVTKSIHAVGVAPDGSLRLLGQMRIK